MACKEACPRRARAGRPPVSRESSALSKLIVLYKKPADPAHFDKHFREVHAPLAQKMPGLRGYSFGPTSTLDGGEGAFYWMFIGTFDSLEGRSMRLKLRRARRAVFANV